MDFSSLNFGYNIGSILQSIKCFYNLVHFFTCWVTLHLNKILNSACKHLSINSNSYWSFYLEIQNNSPNQPLRSRPWKNRKGRHGNTDFIKLKVCLRRQQNYFKFSEVSHSYVHKRSFIPV